MIASAPTAPARYWNGAGTYQAAADRLRQLIPASGPVSNPRRNPKLERYRKAVNCYYDLYNNGLCNRASEFSRLFGISVSSYRYSMWRCGRRVRMLDERIYDAVEPLMNWIVREAADEQGLLDLCHRVDAPAMDRRISALTAALRDAHNALAFVSTFAGEAAIKGRAADAMTATIAALQYNE